MSIDRKNIEKIKTKIISVFDNYLNDDYILFLFGSFARNEEERVSDIDLAIYSENILSASFMAQIKEELEKNVPTLRDIDVVNLTMKNINKNLLENILNEGIIWKKTKNSEELLINLKKRLKNLKK